ncbi:hypothetical protein GS491_19080 [Rhodococcus hoagii]|nr:hypothetical protein [Prescottella equi]NKT01825.1 hypothetical protein [Prescottella equi]
MIDIDTLVERIRAQGALSTRPGQMGELDGISDEVEQLIAELREARAAIERVRALAYSFAVGADGEERILEALDGEQ